MELMDILKAKGLEEDAAREILEEMKANRIFTASEENLDIRYGKLKAQHEGVSQQLKAANAQIAQLQEASKGSGDLQQQVETYRQQVTQLQAQLTEKQIDSEAQTGLLAAGVKPDDMDYLLFKLKSGGALELGEDGRVKELEGRISALKQQHPSHFASGKKAHILEHKLPEDGGDPPPTITKETFGKMGYSDRVALRRDDPELYDQMMKG